MRSSCRRSAYGVSRSAEPRLSQTSSRRMTHRARGGAAAGSTDTLRPRTTERRAGGRAARARARAGDPRSRLRWRRRPLRPGLLPPRRPATPNRRPRGAVCPLHRNRRPQRPPSNPPACARWKADYLSGLPAAEMREMGGAFARRMGRVEDSTRTTIIAALNAGDGDLIATNRPSRVGRKSPSLPVDQVREWARGRTPPVNRVDNRLHRLVVPEGSAYAVAYNGRNRVDGTWRQRRRTGWHARSGRSGRG